MATFFAVPLIMVERDGYNQMAETIFELLLSSFPGGRYSVQPSR